MILFVYGTLKRGGHNVRLMGDSVYLRDAVTAPRYRIHDLGAHPALTPDAVGGLAVRGELWEVPPGVLAALDAFEEVPEWFHRAAIEVPGEAEAVEAYFYSRPIPPGLPSADRWPRS